MKVIPLLLALALGLAALTTPTALAEPVRIIYDTDIGNDVDDVLALAMLHSLMTRGDCDLLAVTVTKSAAQAGPFVDAVNTFYGRPDLPIAVIRRPNTPEPGKFLPLADALADGRPRYPHDLKASAEAADPNQLLRKLLSQQPDNSLALVQVGFFSNFAALLDTPGDESSPLTGKELVKQKVKLLSIMAGSFQTMEHNNHYLEYNVKIDVPAAQKLAKEWPTPIVWSGFEIGIAVPYPHESIERDYNYVPHHPVKESYVLYNPPPHDRPTWDLTAVLYAVHPDRGYFDLSPPGAVTVENDGFTRFQPKAKGRDRFLIMSDLQAARVREALVQLSSQPPRRTSRP